MLCMLAENYLVRLKPAMATSTSASAVSQSKSMRGGSYESFEINIALFRDGRKGRTRFRLRFRDNSCFRVGCVSARDRSEGYVT